MGGDYRVTIEDLDPSIFVSTKRDFYIFGAVMLIGCVFSLLSVCMWSYTLATRRESWNCNNNGHRFEARYEVTGPDKETVEAIGKAITGYDSYRLQAIEDAKNKKYVRDVCSYCGMSLGVKESNDKTLKDHH